jgi:hypothetical protein
MPKKKFNTKKRSRTEEALARLRQRWQEENPDEAWEAEQEPVVTPMFKSVESGISGILEALRTHDDDDARAFIETYEQCSASDRKLVSLENIAFASGIGSLRLAEITQTALYLYASAQTKLLISSSMVKVTKSIVKAATDEVPITAYNSETGMQEVVGKTNGDVKAMELFGRISGIAPVPKGAQIAIQNNYGKNEELDKSSSPLWRSSEERLREMQDMTEPKRLPSPSSPPILVGGHIDQLQEDTIHIMRGE